MRKRWLFVVLTLPAYTLCSSLQADSPSPPGTRGNLVVTVEYVGSGTDRPSSGIMNLTWSVKDTFVISGYVEAEKALSVPVLHAMDSSQVAAIENASSEASTAAAGAEPMMSKMEKIADMCGDDDACLQRETMKMMGSMNMSEIAAAGESAKQATTAAQKAVPKGGRYQTFSGGVQTGTFEVDETAHEAYFDAACSTRNESTCSIDTTVKGSGTVRSHDGNPELHGFIAVELDYEAGTALLSFRGLGAGDANQTVKSGSPDRKSGTSQVARYTQPEGAGQNIVPGTCTAGCASASGESTVEAHDFLLRKPVTYKITWEFTRS